MQSFSNWVGMTPTQQSVYLDEVILRDALWQLWLSIDAKDWWIGISKEERLSLLQYLVEESIWWNEFIIQEKKNGNGSHGHGKSNMHSCGLREEKQYICSLSIQLTASPNQIVLFFFPKWRTLVENGTKNGHLHILRRMLFHQSMQIATLR